MIDAVVHSVAGDDYLGLHRVERALQAFENARPRKGVVVFSQPGSRLAAQADTDDIEVVRWVCLIEIKLDECHVAAGLGDAVAQPKDFFSGKRGRRIGAKRAEGEQEDDQRAETEKRA